ncbi:helix-turn-helix domain-containing protein [Bacillus sp. FJAT-47783]|uniref:helix-turn-helix domain-containing protein n=1 Tax=Bacillus sp. FJAT-47783 TaxID=2922712 RepID=UPI001FADB2C9|nr:helix-turn-helix domain-containing protein [Bacillus sp. FJAT-47783]
MSELGNLLKEARLEKNYSLDELQQITKIQKRYLVGIEEGNYAVMPGNFYVRAFIKQYAEAVGLDPEELFERFENEIPTTYNDDLPEQLSRVRTHKQMPKSASKALEFLPRVLAVSAIVIVAVIVWVLVQKYTDNKQSENVANGESDEVQVESSGINPSQPEEQKEPGEAAEEQKEQTEKEEKSNDKQQLTVIETKNNQTSYELTNTDRFTLKIASKGRTWLEVKNAKGKKFYYKVMPENNEQTFDLTAESEIHLVIGATNNATIFINDEEVPYEISPNEKVDQRFKIVYKKSE